MGLAGCRKTRAGSSEIEKFSTNNPVDLKQKRAQFGPVEIFDRGQNDPQGEINQGIHLVFRGLKFESEAEIGQRGAFLKVSSGSGLFLFRIAKVSIQFYG